MCIVFQVGVFWQRHCDIDGAVHRDGGPVAAEEVDTDGSDRGEVIPGAVS